MNIPPELTWANAPFVGQPTTFHHSLIYVWSDCLVSVKTHRDRNHPKTTHCNAQLILFACAFFEAALSRGLIAAAQFQLSQLERTPKNKMRRKILEKRISWLFEGETYGDPLAAKSNGYATAILEVLEIEVAKAIPPETSKAVRCLFLLRNSVVHGQTILAGGTMPAKFEAPVIDYQLAPTKKKNLTDLASHLRERNLLTSMTLAGGVGFPFLTDPIVDHFLRNMVEFFRALQPAILDEKRRHEFGAGLPQNIFPILAGEMEIL